MSVDPEHIQKIITAAPKDPHWIVVVSDRAGRIIARSERHHDFVGRELDAGVRAASTGLEGVHRIVGQSNIETVRGYSWSTRSGWMIAAFVPAQVVDAPLRDLWRLFSLFALAVAALALPLVHTLGKQITEPIAAAADAARSLVRGETVVVKPSRLLEANKLSETMSKASIELRDRTRSLAETAARYRSVFEQSAVGFEQVDLDGKFINLNDTLCQMLGYTREECLEKTFGVITHADDLAAESQMIDRLLKGETPHYSVEKRLLTKSGEPIWVNLTSSLVRGEDGKPLYRTSVVQDVTQRRKSRQSVARLAAIVTVSPDALISMSLAGDIETWNPAAEALFGYPADDIIGKSIALVAPGARSPDGEKNIAAVARGETVERETVCRHRDGTPIDVSMTATPIRTNDEITSISLTVEDIRDRKMRDAHILLLNRELAHRVKNTLAVIQSIANQTVRANPEPEAFRSAFQGRLRALAAANDMLTHTSWQGAEFRDFADRQLSPLIAMGSMQLIKTGPHMLVPAELSVHLGLALHELGTNAIKHGAWSVPGGQVRLSWELTGGPEEPHHLVVTWSEHNGPPVRAPSRLGFGTTLIERGIPEATVERSFLPDGLVCRIDVLLPERRDQDE